MTYLFQTNKKSILIQDVSLELATKQAEKYCFEDEKKNLKFIKKSFSF